MSRAALTDLSNNISISTPTKMLIPKLSKRRQSTASVPLVDKKPEELLLQQNMSVKWDELERIANLYIPDQLHSSKALSLISDLRSSVEALDQVKGIEHKQVIVPEQEEVMKLQCHVDDSCDGAATMLQQPLGSVAGAEKENAWNRNGGETVDIKDRNRDQSAQATSMAREKEAVEQERLQVVEETRKKEATEKENALRRENAKKKREHVKEQEKQLKEQEREEEEEALRHSVFLSDEEDSSSGCFVHWDACVSSSTTPPLPSTADSPAPSLTQSPCAAVSASNSKHKRLLEVSTVTSSCSPRDATAPGSFMTRKSPRRAAHSSTPSPDTAMFDSLLLNSPHSSPALCKAESISDAEQDNDTQEHQEEEDYSFGDCGIIHMEESPFPVPLEREISSPEMALTTEEQNIQESEQLQQPAEEQDCQHMTSRAKRRSRRASLLLPPPPPRDLSSRERTGDGKKKRAKSDQTTEAKGTESESLCEHVLSGVSSAESAEVMEFPQNTSLQEECVDDRVVQLVLDQGSMSNKVGSRVCAETCRNMAEGLRESFAAYTLCGNGEKDEDSSSSHGASLARATAALARPSPPASHTTLVLALALMPVPPTAHLLLQHAARLGPLQLALLNVSSELTLQPPAATNPFAALAASSSFSAPPPTASSSPTAPMLSTPPPSKKRLRFQEEGVSVSSCVSPPNDRQPGSALKFELYASVLEGLLNSCDALTCAEPKSPEESSWSTLLSSLTTSLALLSSDSLLVRDLLLKTFPSAEVGAEVAVDVSRMAKVLCVELRLRCLPDSAGGSSGSLQQLCMPLRVVQGSGGVHFRSVLRHRVSWVLTSILRYYLRWLLDEHPLRASMVPLSGDYPTISCRSKLREQVQLLPLPPQDSLLARLRGLKGGRERKGARGRRDSLSPLANGSLSDVMDMGFSSVVVQALDQVYQGLSLCFLRQPPTTSPEPSQRHSAPLQCFGSMLQGASRMAEWVLAEWGHFCSGGGVWGEENLAWQLNFSQTVIAAEQARVFLQGLLALSPLEKIGSVSGVWDKLQDFAGALRRQGLPEDSHYTLLSSLTDLRTLLASSFLPAAGTEGMGEQKLLPLLAGMAVDPLPTLGTLKTMASPSSTPARKARVSAQEKSVIKDVMEACSVIFDFPICQTEPCLSHHESSDHCNNFHTEDGEGENYGIP